VEHGIEILLILPGLVRHDEVASGEIARAIRFTAPQTRRAHVRPARHFASSFTGDDFPPMGQRFRLEAGVDISGCLPRIQFSAPCAASACLVLGIQPFPRPMIPVMNGKTSQRAFCLTETEFLPIRNQVPINMFVH
jgi:hypothetical protein